MKIEVLKAISSANDAIAADNHKLLQKHKVVAINIMSSPGSGKTSLILHTIEGLKNKYNVAVIEGDIASSLDAEKIDKKGIEVMQINTGGNCSLEAHMINSALHRLKLKTMDLLIIENVGNLICPAENELGEHKKIVISSLPEGDDKPYKYPLIFSKVDAVLLNKMDLAPYLDFNVKNFRSGVKGLNPGVEIFEISCKTGKGIGVWIKWLEAQLQAAKS